MFCWSLYILYIFVLSHSMKFIYFQVHRVLILHNEDTVVKRASSYTQIILQQKAYRRIPVLGLSLFYQSRQQAQPTLYKFLAGGKLALLLPYPLHGILLLQSPNRSAMGNAGRLFGRLGLNMKKIPLQGVCSWGLQYLTKNSNFLVERVGIEFKIKFRWLS